MTPGLSEFERVFVEGLAFNLVGLDLSDDQRRITLCEWIIFTRADFAKIMTDASAETIHAKQLRICAAVIQLLRAMDRQGIPKGGHA